MFYFPTPRQNKLFRRRLLRMFIIYAYPSMMYCYSRVNFFLGHLYFPYVILRLLSGITEAINSSWTCSAGLTSIISNSLAIHVISACFRFPKGQIGDLNAIKLAEICSRSSS